MKNEKYIRHFVLTQLTKEELLKKSNIDEKNIPKFDKSDLCHYRESKENEKAGSENPLSKAQSTASKGKMKLLFFLIPCLIIVASIIGIYGVKQANICAEGQCGDNAQWVLTKDGTLTISGEGKISKGKWGKYYTSISKICVEEGITEIAEDTFSTLYASSVTLSESVTEIGKNAFSGCISLKNINIPKGVTKINDSTFNGCKYLKNITIPEGVTYIGMYAFFDCGIEDIIIPQNVKTINMRAFDLCENLKSLTMEGNAPEIPAGIFDDSVKLTIYVPEGASGYDEWPWSGHTVVYGEK